MKKILLILIALLVTVQCINNKPDARQQRQEPEAEYDMPVFSTPEIQDFAYDLLLSVLELKKETENDGESNREEIHKKVTEFTTKVSDISEKLTVDDTKKLTDWVSQLATKLRLENN